MRPPFCLPTHSLSQPAIDCGAAILSACPMMAASSLISSAHRRFVAISATRPFVDHLSFGHMPLSTFPDVRVDCRCCICAGKMALALPLPHPSPTFSREEMALVLLSADPRVFMMLHLVVLQSIFIVYAHLSIILSIDSSYAIYQTFRHISC